jgi:hypothetical protein
MLTEFETLGIVLRPRAQDPERKTCQRQQLTWRWREALLRSGREYGAPVEEDCRRRAEGVAALIAARSQVPTQTAVAPSHVCHRNTGIAGYFRPPGLELLPTNRTTTDVEQDIATKNSKTRSSHVRTQRKDRSVH